ncbi:MAG: BCCT family transporter, partial [Albidovulum sp.]
MAEAEVDDATGLPLPEGETAIIETDYEIGQDNIEGEVGPFAFDVHNRVFIVSAALVIAFVLIALAIPHRTAEFFGWLRPWLTSTFDWFLLSAGNFFLVFCLILVVSPWGAVRLGGSEATPD